MFDGKSSLFFICPELAFYRKGYNTNIRVRTFVAAVVCCIRGDSHLYVIQKKNKNLCMPILTNTNCFKVFHRINHSFIIFYLSLQQGISEAGYICVYLYIRCTNFIHNLILYQMCIQPVWLVRMAKAKTLKILGSKSRVAKNHFLVFVSLFFLKVHLHLKNWSLIPIILIEDPL